MSAAYDRDNLFAKIIRGEIPGNKAFEDGRVLAILDIAPAAPVHILVMPKGDYTSFDDFTWQASAETQTHFYRVIAQLARSTGIDATGYRLIANHGAHASQSVAHFHMHLLGGEAMGGLLPGDEKAR